MTPVLWGIVIGASVTILSGLWRFVKTEIQRRYAIQAEQVRKRAQQEAYAAKVRRHRAQKAKVHFEEKNSAEPEPVTVELGGEIWSEVWLGDTVAFQNVKTGEIVQDGAEFQKLTHSK